MTISVDLVGSGALQAALLALPKAIRDEISEEITGGTAAEMQAEIQNRMTQGPHTGRFYGRHQASAPGEAPAPDTGTLRASVYHEIEDSMTAVVGSRLIYAAYLEYGTTSMSPRPVWEPVALEYRSIFAKRFEEAIKRAIK